MSKEVKRYYTTLAFDRPDIAANCSIQGRPATCTSYELTCVVLASDYEALLAERDAAQKDAERFREIVAAVVREHPHRSANRGNAPGHGHSVPGVWDSDNGALAGTECAWCKTWNEAIAALQGAQP